jgi:hypothetical protein
MVISLYIEVHKIVACQSLVKMPIYTFELNAREDAKALVGDASFEILVGFLVFLFVALVI